MVFFFFFQAEDGIRDLTVTGVQTCALPISVRSLYATTGVEAVQSLQGPFAEALLLWSGRRTAAGRAPADTLALATRYTDTAVETVSLKDGDALAKRLVPGMEAR